MGNSTFYDKSFADAEDVIAITKQINITNGDHCEFCGPPVHSDGKTTSVMADDSMTCVVGSTGSMKTTRVVLPYLQSIIRAEQSAIVIDVKPELLSYTYEMLTNSGYRILILNLGDPRKGNRYSIFDYPTKLAKNGNIDISNELIAEICFANHVDDIRKADDSYFGYAAADLETGAAMLIRDNDYPITYENIMTTILDGEKNFAAGTFFQAYLDDIAGPNNPCTWKLSSTSSLVARETKSCVYSMVQKSLSIYGGEGFKDQMCESDFSISDLAFQKTVLFIVVPAERSTLDPYVSAFIRSAYNELCDCASKQPNGKLPITTHFVLDEFANFPQITDFSKILSTARSHSIRFMIVVQNYAQLVSRYSEEDAHTIFANCSTKIVMRSSDIQMGEYIEKLSGMRTDPVTGSRTPLITARDVMNLDKTRGEVIILIDGLQHPFVTCIPSIYDYPSGIFTYTPMTLFPYRKKKHRRVFDIKEVVKAKKREKLFHSLDQKPVENDEVLQTPLPQRKSRPQRTGTRTSAEGSEEMDGQIQIDNMFSRRHRGLLEDLFSDDDE